jgi:hypothetical protein
MGWKLEFEDFEKLGRYRTLPCYQRASVSLVLEASGFIWTVLHDKGSKA